MKKDERVAQLLDSAVKLASKHGVANVSRRDIAMKCKCSEPLVNTYLGNLADMRKKIKAHARKAGVLLPSATEERDLGSKLRKTKGYGGARKGAGRPTAARAPKQAPLNA